MGWWLALPFALLPLKPEWFGAAVALLGLGLVWKKRPPLVGLFLLVGIVGAVGQLLSPSSIYQEPERPDYLEKTNPQDSRPNLIRPYDLNDFFAWNPKDDAIIRARKVQQGFWRLQRYSPKTGTEQAEFYTNRLYSLQAGQTYTQSFYLRRDGKEAGLQISFFTHRGHHPVPTQMERVAPGVWRVWGSYTAQPGDDWVRAIDFLNQGGDYTYVEAGWAQLEMGFKPTPYRRGDLGELLRGQRAWAWFSQVGLGWLVLVGAGFWLERVERRWVLGFLFLGLAVHLGIGLLQLQTEGVVRAQGLTPQPNFYGHGAVMVAGLILMLRGWLWGAGGLALAASMVGISGSRTAFIALGFLLLLWVLALPRGRVWAIGGLALLLAALWRWPEELGRLGHIFGIDASGEARLQFWQAALQAFREYPRFGVGWGNFPIYYQLHIPPNFVELSGHAHSLVLSLLAEGGVVLLVAFAALWGGILLNLWRLRAWLAIGLISIALMLNLLDYTFFYAAVYHPLWVGLAWAFFQKERVEYPREQRDLPYQQ